MQLLLACSLFVSEEHRLDAAHAGDVTPPTSITNIAYTVTRGEGTCEGTGIVSLTFEVGDNRTPLERIGYEVQPVSGFDDSFSLVAGARVYPFLPGEFLLYFDDDGQAIDVALDLTAVDLNGNRNTPVRIEVRADEVDGGCSVDGGRAADASALLVVLAALVGVRRRGAAGRRGVSPRRA